jgi:hypothetical protein
MFTHQVSLHVRQHGIGRARRPLVQRVNQYGYREARDYAFPAFGFMDRHQHLFRRGSNHCRE